MQGRIILIGAVAMILVGCAPNTSTPDSQTVEADSQVEIAVPTDAGGEAAIEPTVQISDEEQRGEPTLCAAVLTPPNSEGPFYTPGAPERSSLAEPGDVGILVRLTGRVMTELCEPLPGALLDFWQTDTFGEYDNEGFRFRGKLFADENGEYQLDTILPGLYPGRPAHIHVKVTPVDGSEHTTQIYFPGSQFGDADQLVHPALLATLEELSGGNMVATFDFILSP